MAEKYLIDTCAVIKYLEGVYTSEALAFIDKIVDDDSKVSFISKIELLVWNPPILDDIKIRETFLKGTYIYLVNDAIIIKAIDIRKLLNLKVPDALIAATAMVYDLTLLSENDNDFNKVIPLGLKYLNPKTIS